MDWNCSDLEDGILTYGLTGTEFTIASLQKASLHSMEMKNLQENQTYFFKVYCGKPSSEKDFSLFLSNPFQTLKGEIPTLILSKEQIQRGIWILGGSTQSNLAQPAVAITASSNWNYYQPLTNTMSVGSPLPTSLCFPATEISYQTRTLFLFGRASIVNVPVSTVYSLNLSSPTTNAWSNEESMPRSRYGHKAVILSR